MVLNSTESSINNNEISLVAILEVVIASLIYWGIAIYYDFYSHIIVSILLSPFFLLKSKKSVVYALDRVSIVFSKISFSILSFSDKILILIISVISFLTLYFSGNMDSPLIYFSAFIVGAIFSNILLILFLSFYAKFFATLKYLSLGIKNINLNWYLNCFVIDIFKTPEIIPGIEKDERILDDLKFRYFLEKLKTDNYLNKCLRIILISILYITSIFYRYSIKSTFWFYIPLLFLVKTPSSIDANSNNIGCFFSSLYETYFAKLRFILALIVLGIFLITYFKGIDFYELNTSFKSFLFLFYVDFSSLEIWKILQILIAVLTIFIFLWANAVRTPKVSNKIILKKDLSFFTIFYLNIVRNWISFFYFCSAFIYLSFYYKFWENNFIPNGIRSLLTYLKEIIIFTPFS